MQTLASIEKFSFKAFLFQNKRNRTLLKMSAVSIIIQFTVFKYLYPYASYIFGDSFEYIQAAHYNLDINFYLVGYSRFLRLFSVFSSSDTILVAFQYIIIQSSVLVLLFTVFYFYGTSKITQYILMCFMIFNPLFLHLANLISSDCLFTSLSILWLTLLLWIIHKPFKVVLLLQALGLFLAFTIRYNALIYSLIAVIAISLSSLTIKNKIVGMSLGIVLCGLFVVYTGYRYKQLTGVWQYSPFSGWQLANNAMYSYRYVDSTNRKNVPEKFRLLDNMICEYFDSTRDIKKFPIESIQASTFYMWSPNLPLVKYREMVFKNGKDSSVSEFKKWSALGPLYKSYGLYIIKSYPLHFLKYFLWPNAKKYYAPPVEFLEGYNSGRDSVTTLAKKWFHYKSIKVKTRMKNNEVWVLAFYPILTGIINVVMLANLIFYVSLKGWRVNQIFSKGVLLSSFIWIVNAGFTIFASSAALRFQSFPILTTTIFSILLTDWLCNIAMSTEIKNIGLENKSKNVSQEAFS